MTRTKSMFWVPVIVFIMMVLVLRVIFTDGQASPDTVSTLHQWATPVIETSAIVNALVAAIVAAIIAAILSAL